jgi:hypothetical protein
MRIERAKLVNLLELGKRRARNPESSRSLREDPAGGRETPVR